MLNKKTIILIIISTIVASAVVLAYADRNAEELIGRDDSKGKFEEQKQEAKERPADKISTTTMAKNTDVSAEEIDTSDWQTYRNEEYGFEVKYPEGWFVRVNEKYKNTFGRVNIDFSNSDKFFSKDNPFLHLMEIEIIIYDKKNKTAIENYNRLKEFSNETRSIMLQNGQNVILYIISKKSETVDDTWDITLPVAGAFIPTNKYNYKFGHAAEINKEDQQKEVEILEAMLKSFTIIK